MHREEHSLRLCRTLSGPDRGKERPLKNQAAAAQVEKKVNQQFIPVNVSLHEHEVNLALNSFYAM